MESDAVNKYVGDKLDAAPEAFGIWKQVTCPAAPAVPQVIDANVFVSGRLHAGGDHRIRHLAEQCIADFRAELVLTYPVWSENSSCRFLSAISGQRRVRVRRQVVLGRTWSRHLGRSFR